MIPKHRGMKCVHGYGTEFAHRMAATGENTGHVVEYVCSFVCFLKFLSGLLCRKRKLSRKAYADLDSAKKIQVICVRPCFKNIC